MRKLHMIAASAGALALCMAKDDAAAGGAPDAPNPDTRNPADAAAPHPDDAKATAKAQKTADTNVADHDGDGDGKLRYRVAVEFHDTTTGRLRRKGRTVKADADRAAVLLAAGVIHGTPLEADEPDDEGDDAEGQNADTGVNENAIAPATVGGPVDAAVIADQGAGAAVTDGQRDGTLPGALTTGDAPAIVSGKGGGKAK